MRSSTSPALQPFGPRARSSHAFSSASVGGGSVFFSRVSILVNPPAWSQPFFPYGSPYSHCNPNGSTLQRGLTIRGLALRPTLPFQQQQDIVDLPEVVGCVSHHLLREP